MLSVSLNKTFPSFLPNSVAIIIFYCNWFRLFQGLQYVLDLKTRLCNVSAITTPFRPFAIPPDAKFKETVVYGAAGIPDQHVNLNRFEGEKGGRKYIGL